MFNIVVLQRAESWPGVLVASPALEPSPRPHPPHLLRGGLQPVGAGRPGAPGPGSAVRPRDTHPAAAQDHLLASGQAGGGRTDFSRYNSPGRDGESDLVHGRSTAGRILWLVSSGADPGSSAFWPLDPGSGMGKKSRSGIRIGMRIRIRDPDSFWSRIEKIRIRDKHPGSVTPLMRIHKPLFDLGW